MAPRTAGGVNTVRVRGLVRYFGDRGVLDDLDLDIARGEFVALIGRSGSGKSTLLRALAGLDPGTAGELQVNGAVAVAFQEPRLVPWRRVCPTSAWACAPTTPGRWGAGADRGGPDRPGQRLAAKLSGGEAQRASLARALVREPSLLLLDEPFSALDALTRITMHRLVLRLWEQHQPAVLLVTHDVDEALVLADRVLVLADGRITYGCRVDEPRPRDRDQPELAALRRLLAELGVPLEGTG